jgi:type I restriction enzyme S subunit
MTPDAADGLLQDARLTWHPDDWLLKRLSEVCHVRNHLRKPLSDAERQQMQGQYPYYGPTSRVDSLSEFRLDGVYALIGEDGDHFLKYDRMSMTQLIAGKSNVNNHAHILEGSDSCCTEWLFHFFRHRNIVHFLSRQGAGRYKLNKQALLRLPVLVPPLSEQKKIAAILSMWDRAIELTEKLIAAKQQRKAALMQQLLTGKVRLPAFSGDWSTLKAGDIFKPVSTKNHPSERVLSVTQDMGVVSRDEMDRKINMSLENTGGYKLVLPGDFIISLRSFQGGLEMSRLRGIVSPAYHVIRPAIEIDIEFFRYFFKSYEFVGRLAVAVIGIRDGKQVNFEDFAFLKFHVPPLDEQKAISSILNTQEREIELLQQKLDALRRQKKGLMQRLLTGKIRVKVTESSGE